MIRTAGKKKIHHEAHEEHEGVTKKKEKRREARKRCVSCNPIVRELRSLSPPPLRESFVFFVRFVVK